MGHDPSKVVLGGTLSSIKEVGNRKGTVLAGTAVRQKSDGTMSTISSDGGFIGVSMGKDLSGAGFTSIAYRGEKVPLRLGAAFTPTLGAVVHIDNATGLGVASGAGATATSAVYNSGLLSGLTEGGGSEVPVALIDFPGGL